MKKNPIHSYLYKEYKKQVININNLQQIITQYKAFLSQRSNNDYANELSKAHLIKTREELKYHQTIVRYLKHEILFHNTLINPKPGPNKNIIHVKSVLYSTNCPQHITVNLKTKQNKL